MTNEQIADVVAWQRMSAEHHRRAIRFIEDGFFKLAVRSQMHAAKFSRWAREEMGIEPRTYLD